MRLKRKRKELKVFSLMSVQCCLFPGETTGTKSTLVVHYHDFIASIFIPVSLNTTVNSLRDEDGFGPWKSLRELPK